MSTVTVDPVSRVPELRSLTHVSTRRRVKNLIMTLAMGLSLVLVTAVLLIVLVTVIGKGLSVVFTNFPDWFTQDISASNRRPGGGMRAAIVGTLVITAAATALAVPLGIGGAVYLNEYGTTSPFARLLRFLTNVMAGVPSIVMGLFIFVAWVLLLGQRAISGFSGALALACLMLPVVVRSTEEMLKLVPQHLRDASYALGGSRSRTTMTVVLPSAAPGILSGCLLAIARAAGETAPLIFTIGAARAMNLNVFSGTNTALSTQIYANARTTFPVAQDAGVGRRADVDRDGVRVHAAGAGRVGSIGQDAMTATGAQKETRGPMTSMATRTQHTMDDTALPDLAVNLPLVSEAQPSGPLVFDVDDLAVYYGTFKAVREVFLDVHAERGDRVHRAVRLRQEHRTALLQPDERHRARRAGRGTDHVPRHRSLRPGHLGDAGAASHRDGVPEAEPLSQEHL